MAKLLTINLDYCSSIEELPSSFGYQPRLCHLSLRRHKSPSKSISLHTVTQYNFLRTLNLRCRPMESEVFLQNLQAFSYLENLDLSGNNNLIRLPATISSLCHLRKLNLNECHRLQVLHGLPPSIQVLEANNCCSLEKIEDLLTEYDCWNHISFINCQKLLEGGDNERYFDKILQQSFFKRCAVVEGPRKIVIPGNKIPNWFKEQPGYHISLMMPPKRSNTEILGIAMCGVFPGEWQGTHYDPHIIVNFEKDGKSIIQKEEVDGINASTAAENGNTWIWYRPCSSLQDLQREDWSGGGALLISVCLPNGAKAVRCAALLMYKEEEDNQQIIKTCIGRPWVTGRERQKSIHLMPPHLRPPKSSRIRNSRVIS